MVLGRYGQTVYGMYGTNPEDAGTGTILACLLGWEMVINDHCRGSVIVTVTHMISTRHRLGL